MNLLLGLRRKGSIQSQKRTLWKRFFGDKLVVLGAVIVVGFLLIALLGPYIAPYDYAEQFRPQGSGLLPLDVMSTARTGEFLILDSEAIIIIYFNR